MTNYSGSRREEYSPRAGLCAIGLKLQQLGLFEEVRQRVRIAQKTIYYTPMEKLESAFIALLAGARGMSEINTRLRNDVGLQRAFGHHECADQSVVQDTLNACSKENVEQLEAAHREILRRYSHTFRHDYERAHLLVDIDLTGLPCGRQAERSRKGYFDGEIRYGRQLGRVVAAQYQEILVDKLYPGNVNLNTNLRDLVGRLELLLGLDDEKKRRRIVLRIDAGGGSWDDIDWMLGRGYQLHCKELSQQRPIRLAHTVKRWIADPKVPGRELGWIEAERSWYVITPYCRPVRRVALRQRRKDGSIGYSSLLISTLTPQEVITLMQLPVHTLKDEAALIRAYSHLYDDRAGAIEIENKQDKQGIGITKRNKKKFSAQQMVMLLGTLAHNVLIWAKEWLGRVSPRLLQYGILRLVRDVLATPGMVKMERNFVVGIALNDTNRITDALVKALRAILPPLIEIDLGTG
jgi:hypothetical protein